MKKEKPLPIEKSIVFYLQRKLNNNKIKVEDILEWTTSEEMRNKNLQEDEMPLDCCGVFVAVKKSLDKSNK